MINPSPEQGQEGLWKKQGTNSLNHLLPEGCWDIAYGATGDSLLSQVQQDGVGDVHREVDNLGCDPREKGDKIRVHRGVAGPSQGG